MSCFEFFDSDVLLGLPFFGFETQQNLDRRRFLTQEVGLLRWLVRERGEQRVDLSDVETISSAPGR
jgi:hypothetical protein